MNPRYLAYCAAHGWRTPEAMLEHDKKLYPGGCMCGFILWMNEQWSDFETDHVLQARRKGHDILITSFDRSVWRLMNADAFDMWLQEKNVIQA